jgi:hypothetical protein
MQWRIPASLTPHTSIELKESSLKYLPFVMEVNWSIKTEGKTPSSGKISIANSGIPVCKQ